MGRDASIGMGGRLPWPKLPADMARFRRLTHGKAVILGSRTWDSLPIKPLDGRLNIILTRDTDAAYERIRCVDRGNRHLIEPAKRISDAIILADAWSTWKDQDEACVIGGAEVYRTFLPLAHAIHLTLVDAEYPDADTHFPQGVPDWSPGGPWRVVASERREAGGRADGGPGGRSGGGAGGPSVPGMEFVTLERRGASHEPVV